MNRRILSIFLVILIMIFSSCSKSKLTENENYTEDTSTGENELLENQNMDSTDDITEEHTTEEKLENTDSTEQNVYEGKHYIFYKTDYENLPEGTHNIRSVYDIDVYWEAKYQSLFIGQVLTLFGEPDYSTSDYENVLSYVVAAEDKNGNVIYLDVYFGPSGPAIGGLDGDDYDLAAKELDKIIMAAEPTDYEIESFYDDLDIGIKMGVKNGEPYYEDIWPEGMFDE